MAETVLVTGGTGYVAGWCIVDLLRRGYTVRATVRNLAKADSIRAAVATQIDPGDRLSFFAADLMKDDGWAAAVGGCDYVLHVASPIGIVSKDVDAYVRPAREGAIRVLGAAVKANVRRVVLTSSCGAATPTKMGVDTVSDETTWSDPEAQKNDYYRLSKTLAERAAWDFMKEQGGKTELVTVLPSGVFGPVLHMDGLGSVQFILRLIDGRLPRVPNVGLNIIDVRDLAIAHSLAMTTPEAAGQRLIASGDFMWMKDIAATLRARLGDRAPKIPTKTLPDLVVNLGANFNTALATLKPLLHRSHRFASTKARRVLNWSTRPASETVIDCAESLLAQPEA